MFIKGILILLFATLNYVISQLSDSDISHIVKTIKEDQNDKTGLFSNEIDSTYKAIFSLKNLEENIPLSSKICRELSFDLNNNANKVLLESNELLNCKLEINDETFMKNFDVVNANNLSLKTLYERVELEHKLKRLNGEKLKQYFETAKTFLNSENLFTGSANSNIEGESVLLVNSYGIRLVGIIVTNTEDLEIRKNGTSLIKKISSNLNKFFYELKDVINFFKK